MSSVKLTQSQRLECSSTESWQVVQTRIPPFPGKGEPGNDDDETTWGTARGNKTTSLVRECPNRAPTTTRPRYLIQVPTRKCDEIEAKLVELKNSAARIFSKGTEEVKEKVSEHCEVYAFCIMSSRWSSRTRHSLQPKMSRSGQKGYSDIMLCRVPRACAKSRP